MKPQIKNTDINIAILLIIIDGIWLLTKNIWMHWNFQNPIPLKWKMQFQNYSIRWDLITGDP